MAQPEPPPNGQEHSERVQELARAIRAHGAPVQAVLCGFDLWLELIGGPLVTYRDYLPGGRPAGHEDAEAKLKVPMPVLGKRIVLAFDPSLPPGTWELRPPIAQTGPGR